MIRTLGAPPIAIAPPVSRSWSLPDTMSTRNTVILTIGLIAAAMVVVALASLFAGDISERAGGIVTSVLGSLATVLAGLLLFLRLDTVSNKVEAVAQKADAVEAKVERVHDDVLNGPLRANVKRAIAEAETDPEIVEKRIETTAKGVQQDRHSSASREQAAYARGVTDAMKRWGLEGEPPPEVAP